MRLGLRFGFDAAQGGAVAVDYAAEVQTLLSGTTGFVVDPNDVSTLWKDIAATSGVTAANDAVARINTKWGTTSYNFQQNTAAARPLWDGSGGLTLDGVDDYFNGASLVGWPNNVPAIFMCARVDPGAFGGTERAIASMNFSGSINDDKFLARIGLTGQVTPIGRRVVANASSTLTGTSMSGAAQTVSLLFDPAGAGTIQGWLDGVSIGAAVAFASTGNFEAINSTKARLFSASDGGTGGQFYLGKAGRMVFAPFAPSAAQRASCEGWVAAGAAL